MSFPSDLCILDSSRRLYDYDLKYIYNTYLYRPLWSLFHCVNSGIFCSNAPIESIYFNKQMKKFTVKRAFQKKVFFLENLSSPATMLSHWTPKQRSGGRRVGPWHPPCIWPDATDQEPEHIPPRSPIPEQNGPPTLVWLCQAWHPGLPPAAHFLPTQLVHSAVYFHSLCREISLSCNPKEILTYTCAIWRNHWLPKESIKMYFSLSHLCERHLFALSLTVGDTHVSSAPWLLPSTSAPLLLLLPLPLPLPFPLPVPAGICADVDQPHL